jgi:High potential iron-sulfur protein
LRRYLQAVSIWEMVKVGIISNKTASPRRRGFMVDASRVWLLEFSRRALLQGVACGAGAVTILSATMNRAAAAKMSQQAVAYQGSPKGNQRCDNCALFQPPNACKSVDGNISPQGWCKIYVPKR